jgi:hypothetical protein
MGDYGVYALTLVTLSRVLRSLTSRKKGTLSPLKNSGSLEGLI